MVNKDMVNQDMANQDMVNQDMVNHRTDLMVNKDMVNKDMVNQDMANQDMVNQDMVNQDMVNQDMVNQDIRSTEHHRSTSNKLLLPLPLEVLREVCQCKLMEEECREVCHLLEACRNLMEEELCSKRRSLQVHL